MKTLVSFIIVLVAIVMIVPPIAAQDITLARFQQLTDEGTKIEIQKAGNPLALERIQIREKVQRDILRAYRVEVTSQDLEMRQTVLAAYDRINRIKNYSADLQKAFSDLIKNKPLKEQSIHARQLLVALQ